ncbi:MAG: hypothetical protein EXR71_10565 [Myxococcales bacterium]|nr:hypothetical protein [Myxococcales bacterium]
MSFLDNVKLAYSCPLAWDKLVGGASRRHCTQCDRHVTNLSAMTRGQAHVWLGRTQGAPICIRIEVDKRGRSVHRPTLRNAALAAIAVGSTACSTHDDSGWETGDFVDTGVQIAETTSGRTELRVSAGGGAGEGVAADAMWAGRGSLVADRANARLELTRGEQERAAEAASLIHDVRGEPAPDYAEHLVGRPLMGKPSRPSAR